MADIPATAVDHYRLVLRLQAEAVRAARRYWRQVVPNAISQTWRPMVRDLAEFTNSARWDAAYDGAAYSALTLADQGRYVKPEFFVNVDALVQATPNGGVVEDALYVPAIRAKQALGRGESVAAAMRSGQLALEGIVATMVADTARQAAGVDIVARPGVGYVRMLNPPSCGRCTVLAGKFYRWNAGFLLHPRCDCVHVASAVKSTAGARAEGLIDDPYEYFNSLPTEAELREKYPELTARQLRDRGLLSQEAMFGKFEARAIRDGGDLFQVVNARRGRKGLFTTEGTTRRGYWGSLDPDRPRSVRRPTPEWVYRNAKNRDEVIRGLERAGYILPGGQNPKGSLRGQAEGFGQYGRGGTRRKASQAVIDARAAGKRDPNNPYTMTAAERRLWEARRNVGAARAGVNPYSPSFTELFWGLPQTSGPIGVPSARQLALAEGSYRRWLATGGQIYTR